MHKPGQTVWDSSRNHFDFLRLALALLVIYSHSYPLGMGTEVDEPFLRMTRGQMTGGAIAVDLFFIMSGFLITASAERSASVWGFFRKRAARIYPAFVVLAVVTAMVIVPLAYATVAGDTWAGRAWNVLLQTLRLREFEYSGAFAGNPFPGSINGSVWSIQFEVWCYVGVAILLAAGWLKQRTLLFAAFVVSVLLSVLFQTQGWIFGGKFLGVLLGSPQLWARLLPLYLGGVVFYLYRERIAHSGWLAGVAGALLLGACRQPVAMTAIFPVAATYLIFYFAFWRSLRLPRAGAYGDFSYGTYLYAFPIQQLVMSSTGGRMAPWKLFLVAAPLTVSCAVASWYGVERWFLRRGIKGAGPAAVTSGVVQPA